MKCPHCQAENPVGSEFCGDCGLSLLSERVCPQCGKTNPPDKRFCNKCGHALVEKVLVITAQASQPPQPTSFAGGRYKVKKFLGEGGKKKVYLAHDTVLDRDVAFALIKTEKLDEVARTRIIREVQAMGRLGDHPNIVTVYDFGDHEGQPYIVLPLMPGDVEGLIEKAPEHRLPMEKAIEIARSACRGLEFAHAKGIIHRDVKPGNVLLSADGTAKIGDFGLAVAVDLSRLTQSGMMVGTVAYMPPEQAMGGKVTTKADLYSLGAMLYEMVTGRPPFVGDDSISIIGQHINTPPVSPAWHRADLPPALETLIMQLLEKDPEKRPESATVVLQALETIGAGKIKEPSKEATPSENPLYRRVFIGREPELRQLQSAFDGAMSGQGTLMMVMGEPGIGKTALCYQLSTYVTLRGGRTLVGHCYEEGSLSLPYLAFVEALRSYVLSREVKDLREELGTGAADVARIVSEIRERLKVKPRPQKDPEEERYRLLQAVTSFLTNAAGVQPLLVVLEDLHDADKGTLDMLTHVSRHLAGARLLIVGTYRDVEVDRSHPLSAALAELRRVSSYGRVILRGLNPDEVRRMLESITRESVPWGLAEAVHRQTEGNPLFVQEVVRYLAEEGLITQKEGRWRPAKDTPLEMNIPEGLRDVIGKRLSLLSKECNQLLSVASVIGREFRLEVLQKVGGLSDEELFKTLEQAKKAAVIEERAGVGAAVSYRFAHAFFRQTLYEETIAPRRIRLHQQVARALEEIYVSRLEEHAAELTEHFSHSSDAADLKKAVSYGEMAAKRAYDVYAYGEAARLLEQAIKVQEILDPEDKAKRCDLLLALCHVLSTGGEPRRALDKELKEAFAVAEERGDRERASRACTMAVLALHAYAAVDARLWGSAEAAQWVDRADRYAQPETLARVWADQGLADLKCLNGLYRQQNEVMREGLIALRRARELARRLGEPQAFWFTSCLFLVYAQAPRFSIERRRLAEELEIQSRAGVNTESLGVSLLCTGGSLLEGGHRQRAERLIDEVRELAARSGQPVLKLVALAADSIGSYLDGSLEKTIEISQNVLALAGELGLVPFASSLTGMGVDITAMRLGKVDEISILIPAGIVRVITRGCPGPDPEVAAILDTMIQLRPEILTDKDLSWSFVDVMYLEAAVLVGHKKAAELLLNRFKDIDLHTAGLYPVISVDRNLGGAAAILGKYDEARKYYQEAIQFCMGIRFRPELALTRLQLAELLLEHYPDEKKEALEHLDFAIKEFREMKMQPSLERALRHKDILKA